MRNGEQIIVKSCPKQNVTSSQLSVEMDDTSVTNRYIITNSTKMLPCDTAMLPSDVKLYLIMPMYASGNTLSLMVEPITTQKGAILLIRLNFNPSMDK